MNESTRICGDDKVWTASPSINDIPILSCEVKDHYYSPHIGEFIGYEDHRVTINFLDHTILNLDRMGATCRIIDPLGQEFPCIPVSNPSSKFRHQIYLAMEFREWVLMTKQQQEVAAQMKTKIVYDMKKDMQFSKTILQAHSYCIPGPNILLFFFLPFICLIVFDLSRKPEIERGDPIEDLTTDKINRNESATSQCKWLPSDCTELLKDIQQQVLMCAIFNCLFIVQMLHKKSKRRSKLVAPNNACVVYT
ncbi:hypothetical protein RFI_10463 [Reticulomyxa filosa]|uniref:C5orf34-like C-terminal domain-containing protein n=1 Tax=Reticulomyxa filosa TaxID=46433 RepID=X6NMN7_RETFI|nr:hypothetical protein RFI_10463 [Reticulomyxa filosa]|eukprot:ETO26667.1 hypothetical protein RFI_10463 [Reticulomyxa filosa]